MCNQAGLLQGLKLRDQAALAWIYPYIAIREFPKIGVPNLGVLIIGILLFRVPY